MKVLKKSITSSIFLATLLDLFLKFWVIWGKKKWYVGNWLRQFFPWNCKACFSNWCFGASAFICILILFDFEIFFFFWSFCWEHSWGNDFAVQCLSLIGFIEKMEIWLSRFMIHFGFIWMNDNIQSKDNKHPFTNFVGVWVWHPHGSTLPILLRMAKEVCITCTPVNPHKFWTYWPSGSMAK